MLTELAGPLHAGTITYKTTSRLELLMEASQRPCTAVRRRILQHACMLPTDARRVHCWNAAGATMVHNWCTHPKHSAAWVQPCLLRGCSVRSSVPHASGHVSTSIN